MSYSCSVFKLNFSYLWCSLNFDLYFSIMLHFRYDSFRSICTLATSNYSADLCSRYYFSILMSRLLNFYQVLKHLFIVAIFYYLLTYKFQCIPKWPPLIFFIDKQFEMNPSFWGGRNTKTFWLKFQSFWKLIWIENAYSTILIWI